MITHTRIGPAGTSKLHRRRALGAAAGLLCLCAFSPLAMAATFVSESGPGTVLNEESSGPNLTSFTMNFQNQDANNVLNWNSAVGGDEAFDIVINLNSSPKLSGSGAADPETGKGMLRMRWERDPLNAANAPTDDDWSGLQSIIRLVGIGGSVSLASSELTSTYYEVILAFSDTGGANVAIVDYDWTNFNFSSGGPFVIELEPGYVPVPPALWLFGSGLLAVAGISRRRREKGRPAANTPAAGGAL